MTPAELRNELRAGILAVCEGTATPGQFGAFVAQHIDTILAALAALESDDRLRAERVEAVEATD